jgi:hypothetical protein
MVVLAAIVCGASLRTMAQQKEGNPAGDKGLPDAPAAGVSPRVPTASVSGTVLDANGDVIQGATVSLVAMSGGAQRTLISGENGQFTFAGVAAGSFRVIVTGQGMGRFDSGEFTLQAGDVHTISQAILPVSAGSTDVRVVGNREELAEEQVHIAIDQRVLGVLPNFYSTYNWNAPPMGSKQKFHLAFRAVTDPVAFVGVGVAAGFEQMNNTFPGYGAGAQGFGKRFGAAYADDAIGRMIGSAILPSVLHQDPRYFYKGSGSVRSRAIYAIEAAFVCRGDNGRSEPNYSHLLGSFAAGGISNLYYPPASRGVSLTLENGLIETGGHAANNLVREFLLRRLTPKVPDSANGKP